ncbi:MAG: serA [Patescibacteria group bacterium]|nr:serA [Patescibacteria group bacterium]
MVEHTKSRHSIPKERTRVLLLENIHPSALEVMEREGYQTEVLTGSLTEEELVERIADVSILGIRSNTTVNAKVLARAKRLLAVGAFCIGTNQIDLVEAAGRGVAVFNAPFSNTRSVVELAIAEIIALNRRLMDRNTKTHAGQWDKSAVGSHEVRGRRLGIVGYGNIGSQLSVLAENLGMRVYYYDLADKLSLGNAKRCESLEELLAAVDVVTLHVDGRAANKGSFGEEQFALMRPGSLFLNLSRGMVVDAAALRRHLDSGHLAGAAVDVFPKEPKNKGERFVSELQGLPNVILTPHVAGSTEEAQADIGRFVASKLVDFVNEGRTALSVNMPGLALPPQEGSHRLIWIHRNAAGALARMNTALSQLGANIDAQYLGTSGDTGYVITDINESYSPETAGQLRAMPETIRLRILY